MLKPFLKVLVAGTIGFLSIMGGYLVLALLDDRLPVGVSNTTLIATMLIPTPIGLWVGWGGSRGLDRRTPPGLNQPRWGCCDAANGVCEAARASLALPRDDFLAAVTGCARQDAATVQQPWRPPA